MRSFSKRFNQLYWGSLFLALLLVGCRGQVSAPVASERISTAPRGESLKQPVGLNVAKIPSATNTLVPDVLPSLEVLAPPTETTFQSTLSPTPEITETTMPTTVAMTAAVEQETNETVTCLVEEDRTFEAEVIALMNAERAAVGLGPLVEQSQLTAAARQHSTDMACNQFFDHVSPSTGTVIDRVSELGYSYSFIGENIAAGHLTPEEVVAAWMDSSSHRENILNPEYTQVGVGFIYYSNSEYGTYWTAVYGKP